MMLVCAPCICCRGRVDTFRIETVLFEIMVFSKSEYGCRVRRHSGDKERNLMKRWAVIGFCLVLALGLAACDCNKQQRLEEARQAREAAEYQARLEAAQPLPGDAPARQLLHYRPEEATFAVAVPSMELLDEKVKLLEEKSGQPLFGFLTAGLQSEILAPLELEKVSSFAELAGALGVDSAAPLAFFVVLHPTALPEFAAVLPVKDAGLFSKKAALAGDGLVTDVKENSLGMLATKPALLKGMHAREANPAEIFWGRGNYPGSGGDEIVLTGAMDAIKKVLTPEFRWEMQFVAPVLAYFTEKCDEGMIGIGLDSDTLHLRMAGHDRPVPPPAPDPAITEMPSTEEAPPPPPPALGLYRCIPEGSLVLADLHVSDGLLDFIESMALAFEQDKQAVNMGKNVLSNGFEDEIALSLRGIENDMPQVLSIMQLTSLNKIRLFLGFLGIGNEPQFTHAAVPVFRTKTGKLLKMDIGLFLGLMEKYLIAGHDPEMMKSAIGALTSEEKALPLHTAVSSEVITRGNHGFILIDANRLMLEAPELPIELQPVQLPQDLDPVALTLRHDGLWRELMLSVPAIDIGALREDSVRQVSDQSARSQNQLKQMALVLKMYANESKGELFPPLSSEPGRLMMVPETVYPEYLTDPLVLYYPGTEPETLAEPLTAIDDQSYFYFSHVLRNEEDAAAWAAAYRAATAEGGSMDEDLEISEEKTLYRLREGIERFYITDINDPAASARTRSEIILMMERPGISGEAAINVLFMDGHVEKVPPARFPNTESFINAVLELDALGEDL
jgi:prepilin-type processing-associated H-X9-DG protein